MNARRHRWALLALVLATGCTRPPAPRANPPDMETGRKAWREGCASCHFIPDRSLQFDRVWIEMIESTTCVTPSEGAPTEEVRASLRAFLETEPPTPWIGLAATVAGPVGEVDAPFESGSLVLESAPIDSARSVRLVWQHQGTLRVPLGKYDIQNYVIERTVGGQTWMLSCTGPGGPSVSVAAEGKSPLAIATGIFVTCKATRTNDGVRISAGLAGHGGMEASLLDFGRASVDRRVPITFQILDAEGRAIGDGTLVYG